MNVIKKRSTRVLTRRRRGPWFACFFKHIGELKPGSSLGFFILLRKNDSLPSVLLCEFKILVIEVALAESYP